MSTPLNAPSLRGVKRTFRGCAKLEDYVMLDKLGEGTFGEVHKARSKKSSKVVALKKILIHNEKDGFPITALREIKLLKMLDHINILRLDEMIVHRQQTKDRKSKAVMYMVTPYMDHDLAGLLENPAVNFTEAQIKCYMLQLLEGVRFLHNSHILHRDMKAANLLINNRGILQIADFGLARHYDEPVPQPGRGGGEAKRDYTTLVVTRWYRPPELLLQLRRYTTAIDMWGVGCVFGEMFKRHPILAGKSDLNQIQIIFDLVGSPTEENMPGWSALPGCEGTTSFVARQGNLSQVFKDQSPAAVALLTDLLRLDWRRRITAIDALQHPYFRKDPKPARPEDLPRYDDSHELDRRRFRDQKAGGAPPPAPAGGTVGMGPEGEWGSHANGGGVHGRHERGWGRDNPRIPSSAAPPRRPPPYDSRRPPPARDAPTSRPGWARPGAEHSLPPRPPRPADGGLPPGRQDPIRTNKDTYIPPYSDGRGPPPPREDRDTPPRRGPAGPPRDEREPRRDGRDWDRDRDSYRDRERPPAAGPPYRDRDRDARPPPAASHASSHRNPNPRGRGRYDSRSRSRSPAAERRENDRDRERDLYRR